jgi:DNA mismatch repair protein MutS
MNLYKEKDYNLTEIKTNIVMIIDKVTFNDLSIFNNDEEQISVFDKLNLTTTNGGREQLSLIFSDPLTTLKAVKERQDVLLFLEKNISHWPTDISNGTVIMLEKFFATAISTIPANPNAMSAANYKTFNNSDYSLVKFSIIHFADFFKGLQKLINLFLEKAPTLLAEKLIRFQELIIKYKSLKNLINKKEKFSAVENLEFGHFFKGRFKQDCIQMIDTYSILDAWCSMAKAKINFNLKYPIFVDKHKAHLNTKQLFHVLLEKPTAYDVQLMENGNFLFLTGANMAGKSTYIKAVGIAVYMAHLGMAVPAQAMELSFFDGLLSNIQVVDNISKGESYFFNEVQRIKNTVEKINNGKKWLVLIDELFKGTNVQDAMKCSSAVVKGLIKINSSIFILSTHLYEIGEELKQYPNIIFKHFETFANNDQLEFSYQLKDGISNDRLGYLILKREGVVDLLESL